MESVVEFLLLPSTLEDEPAPKASHSSPEFSDRFQLLLLVMDVRENIEPRLLNSDLKGLNSPTKGAMVGRQAAMMEEPTSMRAHNVFALEMSN
jgi:hypothetical protein